MNTDAQTNKIARSKFVNSPSTRIRTGKPSPATSAPTIAVITIEISGDFSFQLESANETTMAAKTIDVLRYIVILLYQADARV